MVEHPARTRVGPDDRTATPTAESADLVVTVSTDPSSATASGRAVVTVTGCLDIDTVPLLQAVLDRAFAGSADVCCDLAEVTLCTAAGLAALLRAHRHAGRIGARFQVRGARGVTRTVLRVTGLDRLLADPPPSGPAGPPWSVPSGPGDRGQAREETPDMTTPALVTALTTLAGTPDDAPSVDGLLRDLIRLAADLVGPVRYASVTAYRDGALTTVAASSEVARAVDLAQYADGVGPCLEALDTGKLVAVPDLGSVMLWPGFRDMAARLGLRGSLSVPVFAGSGAPLAALNLYAHDSAGIEALGQRVQSVYDGGEPPDGTGTPSPGDGGDQLVRGLADALRIRDVIQRALGVAMDRGHRSAEEAYLVLRDRAAETERSLVDTARAVLADRAS